MRVRVHVRRPPRHVRQEIKSRLHDFFAEHDIADFRMALSLLARHYGITRPRVRWRRCIEKHKTQALTFDDNRLHLYRPRYWIMRTEPPTDERAWIETFWHEVYHVLTVVREEERADAFAQLAMED